MSDQRGAYAVTTGADEAAPFGDVGHSTAAVCRCGASAHDELSRRCVKGHVMPGNVLALVVGQRSAQLWAAEAQARKEVADAVIADAGFRPGEEPRALAMAAQSLAQALMVQTSAYLRMAEEGGPLSASSRARRAFGVWLAATATIEKHLRIVGLQRRGRPVDPMEAVRQHVQRAHAEATAQRQAEGREP